MEENVQKGGVMRTVGEIDARHIFGNLFLFFEVTEKYNEHKAIVSLRCDPMEVGNIVHLLTAMTKEQRKDYADVLLRLEEANGRN